MGSLGEQEWEKGGESGREEKMEWKWGEWRGRADFKWTDRAP